MRRLTGTTWSYLVLAGAAVVLVAVLAVRVGGLSPSPGAHPGRALMGDAGCFSCHSVAGQGGTMAPPLGSELAAKGEAWIQDYLTSGRNLDVYPGHGHAAFAALRPEQARRIARYLVTLSVSGAYQGPAGPPPER